MPEISKPKAGRPRKLAKIRVYISATTSEESAFIDALMDRKTNEPNFNIGDHLLSLALKGIRAVPTENLSLSNDTIAKLTESISKKLAEDLSKSVIVSGLSNLIKDTTPIPLTTSNTYEPSSSIDPKVDDNSDNCQSLEMEMVNTELIDAPIAVASLPPGILALKGNSFF